VTSSSQCPFVIEDEALFEIKQKSLKDFGPGESCAGEGQGSLLSQTTEVSVGKVVSLPN
jgi:hypothetical protein